MRDDIERTPDGGAQRVFRYEHVVGFQETNVVGNVYFTHHLAWQGRCRELFIRRYAPSVLDDLARDLRLVTLRVACDYHAELFAFDEICVEMRLQERIQNRIRVGFRYWRKALPDGSRTLIAEGMQLLAAMRAGEGGLTPCALPAALADALAPFAEPGGVAHA